MRILIINNVYPDKDNPTNFVFVHKQATALKESGYDICVLDIDLRSARWKRRFGIYHEVYEGILVYRVSFPFLTTRLRKIGKLLNEVIGVLIIRRIIAEWGKPTIVHAHFGFGAGNAGAAVKRLLHIPLVITEHSSKVLNAQSPSNCKYSISAYEEADVVLSVGTRLSAKIQSFGINNILTVPNIIDTDKFRIIEERDEQQYTYISVGHLIASKNQSDLICAFARINTDHDLKLIIVGEGEEKQKLIALSEKLSSQNSIIFIDRIDNDKLPIALNKANCFVLPSLYETFGVVYAEAISCGIPAISYKNGGTDDIIIEGVGIITQENSIDALAEAMKKVLTDERFGKETFLKTMSNIYSDVVSCYKE